MSTITALDFARLDEARRLQVERYRTAYFKREGELPADTDPAIDREYLRVKLGANDKCIPVGTLTKWGKTFGEAAPLTFALDGCFVTVKRGTSSIRLFVHAVEHTDKGVSFRSGCTTPLDAPIVLTVRADGTFELDVPDLAAELKELKAETSANRKFVAREKAIAKAGKAEREALDRLTRATDEANENQAVLDSMTLAGATDLARRCRDARRLYRATLAAPEIVPLWLLSTYQESEYHYDEAKGERADKTITLDTLTVWREHLAAYQTADAALQAYEPRTVWPSYAASLAEEKGLSLAAWKRENPDRAHKKYGPTFEKLKEAKEKELDRLACFVQGRFAEYLTAQGLPECLASQWSVMDCRAYSRARLHLVTWEQRRADLDSQYREAVKAREAATG